MKILITCFLFCSVLLFPQSYVNIHYANGTDNSIAISSIDKITLSPSNDVITFQLTDATTFSENTNDIQGLTLVDNPLPVELSSFIALINKTSVLLKWKTATEVNNYGFEVERSKMLDAKSATFEKIGFINGNGNSNSPKEYSFSDIPKEGTKFLYRLKQIDNDGVYEYSSAINVEIGIPNQYELKQNYPNPFNPTTNISYSLPKDGLVTLKIYDVVGSEIATIVNDYREAGNYSVTFDGSNLSSGLYLCKITSGDFSASIKMILMK